ncbi:MAG: hypothetical protein CMP23_07125 [Rickettsiales bacterium]|nr:hypothetical protein [Rickettsiales bacterium]|tara:strand:+ start:306 stop:674 length:369 start_codon:yes stop_codon:yes gene_type:complete
MSVNTRNNLKRDLIAFVVLLALALGVGVGVRGLHEYLQGDWRAVVGCRSTYWQCASEFRGQGIGSASARKFVGGAKSCEQVKAYDLAIRRASLECSFSRSVRRNSCREVQTNCVLPNSPTFY